MASTEKLTDAELLGLISQTTGGIQNQGSQHITTDLEKVHESTCSNVENHENSSPLSLETNMPSILGGTFIHSDSSQSDMKLAANDFNMEIEQPNSNIFSSTAQSESDISSSTAFTVQTANQPVSNIVHPTVTQSVSQSSESSLVNSMSQSDVKLHVKDDMPSNVKSFPMSNLKSSLSAIKSSSSNTESSSSVIISSTCELKSSSSSKIELESESPSIAQCEIPSSSGSQLNTCSNNVSKTMDKKSEYTNLSKEEAIKLVHECRTELEATKKKLQRSERQLTKANDYNEVLRSMVEKLSSEIHHVKNVQTCSVHVQVDKEDFLNYTTGVDTMPKWNADDESMKMSVETSETPDVVIVTPEIPSTLQAGSETDAISIADSIKQAAEAVVQQQQANMLQDQGYVYDDHSGIYYHPATGYYYDQHKSLFYDPKTGIYYYYDYDTGEYLFHSQIEIPAQNQTTEQPNFMDHDQSKKNLSKVRKSRNTTRKKRDNERHSADDKCNRMEDGVMSQVLLGLEDLKISPYARNARKHALEVAGSYPPCIRMMVLESDYLPVGTLHIVTCTGAKLGRENCDICIPDLNVSKVHAEIQYNEGASQYEIYDHASQNGTFLNDQRLSPAKIASERFVLSHDDYVVISSTKLLCHIHSGSDTCDQCEPGVVIATHKAQLPQNEIKVLSKEERLRQKKQELNQIKKRYGLKNSAYENNVEVFNNPNYTDKAEERRKFVGSDVPGQKQEAPASVHRPISTGNVGHKMLQKMGWKEGDSLGKNNKGIQEPISVTLRASQKAGLGSASAGAFTADDANTVDMRKASRRLQAQQRFKQIEGNSEQKNQTVTNKSWTKGDTEFT